MIYENCHAEALLYRTRKDFGEKGRGAYASAIKRGWLEKICSHMTPLGGTFDIYGYAIEFPNLKQVYVGITCDIPRRKWQHLNGSSNKFVRELVDNGENHLWVSLNDFKGNRYTAKELEESIIGKYKMNGWLILNIKKAGALGSVRKYWTKRRLIKEALKYKTKKEFYTNSPSAYGAAQRLGIIQEITSHLISTKKANRHWQDKTACINAANLCKKQSEFRKKYPAAYKEALKNGWLGGAIIFDISPKNKNGEKTKKMSFWAKENCFSEALKYYNRTDFQKGSKGAYHSARRNKWLDELCGHMKLGKKAAGYWTIETCREEALKYDTRGRFAVGSSAYNIAKKNKWLDDVCKHMVGAWVLKKKAI